MAHRPAEVQPPSQAAPPHPPYSAPAQPSSSSTRQIHSSRALDSQPTPSASAAQPSANSTSKPQQHRNASDLDVFSSLTELKPGTIPLLVRMPDGHQSQITVPLSSTVEDITANLEKDIGAPADDLRLSFGNSELQPGSSLVDTNIVDAYEHAGSLLNVIGQGGLDAEGKAVALDTACAVVESISNGVKDMEALCNAAMETAFLPEPGPQSPRMAHLVAEGEAEAERETPKEIDAGEFKMLNNMLARPPDRHAAQDTPQHQAATPSQLAFSLSRRLPHIFPPSAAAAAFSEDGGPQPNRADRQPEQPSADETEADEQPSLSRRTNSVAQPSISMIREMRRRARQAAVDTPPPPTAEERAANAITFGGSTNGVAFTPGEAGRNDVNHDTSHPIRENAAMMAASAKSTWLEDVFKTWEVGVVRQSGVLEKSKGGQELNEYLHGLEAEAQHEVETAQIEASAENTTGATGEVPGDSSEDEEDADEHYEGTTHSLEEQNASRNHMKPSENRTNANAMENGTHEVRKSIANFGLNDGGLRRTNAASQMVKARSAATAAILDSVRSPESSQHTRVTQTPSPSISRPQPTSSTPSASSGQRHESTRSSDGSGSNDVKPPTPKPRQATKIAPAPPMHAALSPGMPGVSANGMFPTPMFSGGVGAPGVPWRPPAVPANAPKRRGRKRKNPELTEEERALVRKEQNRESAKLSRVRRKVIAAEYEGRLNALIGENTMLRKQVEGLNNRLVYLQSLLTISVRQEPTSDQRLQPSNK